jgi:hypothetical protein
MSRASRYILIWAQPFRGEQGWKKQNFHGRTPPPPPTPHPPPPPLLRSHSPGRH